MNSLQILKKLIKPIVHKLGFDIVRYPRPEPRIERLIQRPFNVLAFVLDYYLSSGAPFFFVQVGANDGVRWDPLHALICKYRLRGLLVEPLPDIFEQLRRNYATESQLSFARCAIATEDGLRSIFRVRSDAPVGDWAHGIASYSRKHLITHLSDVERCEDLIEEVQVPTVTVKTLLRNHAIDRINLLQVDTEGYDFEIVEMFFGEGRLPEIINFERQHLSAKNKQESRRLLAKHGYRFVDVGMDTLGIRTDFSWPLGIDDVDVFDSIPAETPPGTEVRLESV
jgi:FkbM family methyltransferase